MSTYLLAWSFGDFEYIEDFTKRKYNGKNLPVRVYTTRGLKEQGKLALESAHRVVDYFSEVGCTVHLTQGFRLTIVDRSSALTTLCPRLICWLSTNS
jgi:hypothetical protein